MDRSNTITKYELTQLIAARVQQLGTGAASTIGGREAADPLSTSIMELEQGAFPMKLRREYPDGSKAIMDVNTARIKTTDMQHLKAICPDR